MRSLTLAPSPVASPKRYSDTEIAYMLGSCGTFTHARKAYAVIDRSGCVRYLNYLKISVHPAKKDTEFVTMATPLVNYVHTGFYSEYFACMREVICTKCTCLMMRNTYPMCAFWKSLRIHRERICHGLAPTLWPRTKKLDCNFCCMCESLNLWGTRWISLCYVYI